MGKDALFELVRVLIRRLTGGYEHYGLFITGLNFRKSGMKRAVFEQATGMGDIIGKYEERGNGRGDIVFYLCHLDKVRILRNTSKPSVPRMAAESGGFLIAYCDRL